MKTLITVIIVIAVLILIMVKPKVERMSRMDKAIFREAMKKINNGNKKRKNIARLMY